MTDLKVKTLQILLPKEYGASEAIKLRSKVVQPGGGKLRAKLRIDNRKSTPQHDALRLSFQPIAIGEHVCLVLINGMPIDQQFKTMIQQHDLGAAQQVQRTISPRPRRPRTDNESRKSAALSIESSDIVEHVRPSSPRDRTAMAEALGAAYHQVDDDILAQDPGTEPLDHAPGAETIKRKKKADAIRNEIKAELVAERDRIREQKRQEKEERRRLRQQIHQRLVAKKLASDATDVDMDERPAPLVDSRAIPQADAIAEPEIFEGDDQQDPPSTSERQGSSVPCWLCGTLIKHGHDMVLQGQSYCKPDFRAFFIKQKRRRAVIERLLVDGKVTEELLQHVPDISLKGMSFKDVRLAQAMFNSCLSLANGQILTKDCYILLQMVLSRKIGDMAMNQVVEEHIVLVVDSYPVKSEAVVSEVEYLVMLAELLREWAHGTLKAKSAAARKSMKKRSKSKDAFTIMPKDTVSPFDKPSAVHRTVTQTTELEDNKDVGVTGDHFADKWMMY